MSIPRFRVSIMKPKLLLGCIVVDIYISVYVYELCGLGDLCMIDPEVELLSFLGACIVILYGHVCNTWWSGSCIVILLQCLSLYALNHVS